MSFNEEEEEREQFKDFLDLYDNLKEEMEKYKPSKSRIKYLLQQMINTIEGDKTL